MILKSIFLFVALVVFDAQLLCAADPDLKFISKRIINLGDIKADTTVRIKVSFENSGNAPLVLHEIRGSCNCSKTSIGKKLLKPGEKGEAELVIDMKGRNGYTSITATIYTNTTEKTYIIRVIANVIRSP